VITSYTERFETITTTDAPYTTVKLRICYALTPEKDTEVILHDGYGLPEIDRWWERMKTTDIPVPLPAEAQAAQAQTRTAPPARKRKPQATPDLAREVAA
jgi:hypothetical protein